MVIMLEIGYDLIRTLNTVHVIKRDSFSLALLMFKQGQVKYCFIMFLSWNFIKTNFYMSNIFIFLLRVTLKGDFLCSIILHWFKLVEQNLEQNGFNLHICCSWI